jgi:hypothetical protein
MLSTLSHLIVSRSSKTACVDESASSENGSANEAITVHIDSPLVANGSTRASPTKEEKD